ncbi:hypothetical protein D3C75_1158630 [compost metagenome]
MRGFAERLDTDIGQRFAALVGHRQHQYLVVDCQRAQQQVFATEERTQWGRQQGRELGMVVW